MSTIVAPSAASVLIVVDELGSASLTDIAHLSGRSLSTVQRAVSSLERAGVLRREWGRGPYAFAQGAPRAALRQVADWTLGPRHLAALSAVISKANRPDDSTAPETIRNPSIRRAWPYAMRRIVSRFHPKRVMLFGSQAAGNAKSDSDVDLLLVFDRVRDRRERAIEVMRTLSDMPFSKDVIVAGTRDLEHPLRGGVLADALKTGVVVYER
jgi:predicted nucleotidyltransferase